MIVIRIADRTRHNIDHCTTEILTVCYFAIITQESLEGYFTGWFTWEEMVNSM